MKNNIPRLAPDLSPRTDFSANIDFENVHYSDGECPYIRVPTFHTFGTQVLDEEIGTFTIVVLEKLYDE